MKPSPHVRRYRSNPIELVLSLTLGLLLMNSAYQLFYDHPTYVPKTLTVLKSNPLSEGRKLAAEAPSSLMNLDIQCEENVKQTTVSNKLRIKGPLCGNMDKQASRTLIQTSVVNQSNQFKATVFTDLASKNFSTDYIPLTQGDNLIRFEFLYDDGQKIAQDLQIERHPSSN